MVATPSRCRGFEGRTYHLLKMPSHELCVTWRGLQFSNDVICDHCRSCSLAECAAVQDYKLATQHERKRKRRVQSEASSSFSEFTSPSSIPLVIPSSGEFFPLPELSGYKFWDEYHDVSPSPLILIDSCVCNVVVIVRLSLLSTYASTTKLSAQ